MELLTLVICADLQGPVSSHEQANGALLFVFQQLHVPGSPLLPLWGVVVRGEAVELGPPGGGEGNRQERRLNGFLPLSMHRLLPLDNLCSCLVLYKPALAALLQFGFST